MSRQKRKIISGLVTLGVLVGGVAYLFASSAGEAFEYYKHVDEVVAKRGDWSNKHLQMHGFVQPGTLAQHLDKEHQQITYKFMAVNCGQQIEVRYSGTVPDTFKERAEIVVKGSLGDQFFAATEISAKCPSKYQAKADGPAAMLCTRGDQNVETAQAAQK